MDGQYLNEHEQRLRAHPFLAPPRAGEPASSSYVKKSPTAAAAPYYGGAGLTTPISTRSSSSLSGYYEVPSAHVSPPRAVSPMEEAPSTPRSHNEHEALAEERRRAAEAVRLWRHAENAAERATNEATRSRQKVVQLEEELRRSHAHLEEEGSRRRTSEASAARRAKELSEERWRGADARDAMARLEEDRAKLTEDNKAQRRQLESLESRLEQSAVECVRLKGEIASDAAGFQAEMNTKEAEMTAGLARLREEIKSGAASFKAAMLTKEAESTAELARETARATEDRSQLEAELSQTRSQLEAELSQTRSARDRLKEDSEAQKRSIVKLTADLARAEEHQATLQLEIEKSAEREHESIESAKRLFAQRNARDRDRARQAEAAHAEKASELLELWQRLNTNDGQLSLLSSNVPENNDDSEVSRSVALRAKIDEARKGLQSSQRKLVRRNNDDQDGDDDDDSDEDDRAPPQID